jgi:hypothetical protein
VDATVSDPESETQAFVMSTEVVDATDQIHVRLQGFDLPSQSATTPHQTGQALAEGGVEPFNEGGVDGARSPAGDNQTLNQFSAALNNAPRLS